MCHVTTTKKHVLQSHCSSILDWALGGLFLGATWSPPSFPFPEISFNYNDSYFSSSYKPLHSIGYILLACVLTKDIFPRLADGWIPVLRLKTITHGRSRGGSHLQTQSYKRPAQLRSFSTRHSDNSRKPSTNLIPKLPGFTNEDLCFETLQELSKYDTVLMLTTRRQKQPSVFLSKQLCNVDWTWEVESEAEKLGKLPRKKLVLPSIPITDL